MTIKAIFFDIDGTLVPFQSAKWLPSTKLALERLREKGILTFVATGRSKYEIRNEHLLDGLQFDGYLTNNGQDAYDASWSQIYGKPLDPNDVEALLNWSDRRNSTCWLANAETTCINRDSEEYRTAMGAIHTNLLPVGDLHAMNKGPVFKLVLFAPPEEMDEPIRLAPHSRTTQWFSLATILSRWTGERITPCVRCLPATALRPRKPWPSEIPKMTRPCCGRSASAWPWATRRRRRVRLRAM